MPPDPIKTRDVGIESAIFFVGWLLLGVAVAVVGEDTRGYLEPSWMSTAGYAVGALGLAAHVAAVVVSLGAWRRVGRTPAIALSYLVAPFLVAGVVGLGRYQDTQYFRSNTDVFTIETAGDGLDVRDARGVWHVPLSTCPNAVGPRDYIETQEQQYIVDVLDPDGTPFMRIDAAGRRVACVQG